MQALSPGELPDPFDGVKVRRVRRVRRQIVEGESGQVFLSPVSMQLGMVVARVVGDHDHPLLRSSGAGSIECLEKGKEGGAVELARLAAEEETCRSRTAPK